MRTGGIRARALLTGLAWSRDACWRQLGGPFACGRAQVDPGLWVDVPQSARPRWHGWTRIWDHVLFAYRVRYRQLRASACDLARPPDRRGPKPGACKCERLTGLS